MNISVWNWQIPCLQFMSRPSRLTPLCLDSRLVLPSWVVRGPSFQGAQGTDSYFCRQCSGVPGVAAEHPWEPEGKVKSLPHPDQKPSRHSWCNFGCTGAPVQGWKSIPNTQITLSTGLAGFCQVSKNTWALVTEHFIYNIPCVFDFEHTQALHTNPGIDFCPGLCLLYRICFSLALRLLFSLLGNKCDLDDKVPNLHWLGIKWRQLLRDS